MLGQVKIKAKNDSDTSPAMVVMVIMTLMIMIQFIILISMKIFCKVWTKKNQGCKIFLLIEHQIIIIIISPPTFFPGSINDDVIIGIQGRPINKIESAR
jgi:hypothetical protein